MRFPRTARVSALSAATWYGSGIARFGGVVRKTVSRGNGCRDWPTNGSHSHATSILGRTCVLPSNTQGKNRMPEIGPVRVCAGGGERAPSLPRSRALQQHRLLNDLVGAGEQRRRDRSSALVAGESLSKTSGEPCSSVT